MTVGMILPWPIIGAVIGICLLLAVAASLIPARAALRPADRALPFTPRRRRDPHGSV
ncbi:hypothetical protein [Nonomuraea dietziae]|uniref:hypothetical protein n=1 Tax=Nonomuraea dietziae TaxID=65515 RepID=UPI003440DBC4